jgi:hypothetical protein
MKTTISDMEMRINEYKNGRDSILYNAPVAIFVHAPVNSSMPQQDCDAALLMVQLYAAANGLGTCWNGLLQEGATIHPDLLIEKASVGRQNIISLSEK